MFGKRRLLLSTLVLSATALAVGSTDTRTQAVEPDVEQSIAVGPAQDLVNKLEDHGVAADPNFSIAVSQRGVHEPEVVVWTSSGEASAELQEILDSSGVVVHTQRAVLSRQETIRIQEQALAIPGVVGVGIDFTGPIEILVDYNIPRLEIDLAALDPATYVIADMPKIVRLAGRLDDSPPYYGGQWIKGSATGRPGGSASCTSGYGGISTGNGDDYMLTAEHCVNNYDPRFWDGGDDFIGTATARNGIYDVAAIKVPTSPRVWMGAYFSTYSVRVDAVTHPNTQIGKTVCVSGSYVGTQCNGAKIIKYYHFYSEDGWTTDTGKHWPYLVLYHAKPDTTNAGAIAGEGDSGGPVYLEPNQTNGAHHAVGLVHGGSQTSFGLAACKGRAEPTSTCTRDLYFSDVYTNAKNWQLDLTR